VNEGGRKKVDSKPRASSRAPEGGRKGFMGKRAFDILKDGGRWRSDAICDGAREGGSGGSATRLSRRGDKKKTLCISAGGKRKSYRKKKGYLPTRFPHRPREPGPVLEEDPSLLGGSQQRPTPRGESVRSFPRGPGDHVGRSTASSLSPWTTLTVGAGDRKTGERGRRGKKKRITATRPRVESSLGRKPSHATRPLPLDRPRVSAPRANQRG